jgi:signal transduction histidine kinase
LKDEFESIHHALEGTKGVVSILPDLPITRQFGEYAKARNQFDLFPSALGFGFIRLVKDSEKDRYVKQVQRLIPSFRIKSVPGTVHPGGKDLYVIEAIEPLGRNFPALGLDIGSERMRRSAAEYSAKTGQMAITGGIHLVQSGRKEMGLLAFLPIYRDSKNFDSIWGWAYSPVKLSDVILNVQKKLQIDFSYHISDVTEGEEAAVTLFESEGNSQKKFDYRLSVDIPIFGRIWRIEGTGFYFHYYYLIRAFIFVWFALGVYLVFWSNKFVLSFLDRQKSVSHLLQFQDGRMAQAARLSSMGEMAGALAHEMNTPISVIKAQVGFSLQRLENQGLEVDELKKDLLKIEKSANRIAKIVKAMGTYTRGSDQDPLEQVSFSLIADDVISLCKQRFDVSGVELKFEGNLAFDLECRRFQIGQLIMNLLNNSFEALAGKSSAWVKVQVETVGDKMVLSVIDSGRGIDPEIASKMMQSFFTTKREGRGFGLGLSTAQKMAQTYGGEVKYVSDSRNTRFDLILPLRQTVRESSRISQAS